MYIYTPGILGVMGDAMGGASGGAGGAVWERFLVIFLMDNSVESKLVQLTDWRRIL